MAYRKRKYKRKSRVYKSNETLPEIQKKTLRLMVVFGVVLFAFWGNLQRDTISKNPTGYIASIILFVLAIVLYKKWQQWRAKVYRAQYHNLQKLREMDPFEFEEFVAVKLRKQGYKKVKVTAARQDGGYDLSASMGEKHYIIQCKRYKANNKINVDEVRKIYGIAKKIDSSNIPMLITTGFYTKTAHQEAAHYEVVLWDADNILQKLAID